MRLYILNIFILLSFSIFTITADIKWSSYEYDLGEIEEGDGIVTILFELTNDTKKSIVITDISKSCGCTTVEYQHSPIAANESSIIKVAYNPNGEVGAFNRSIIVSTSANKDKQRLSITGSVKPTQESLDSKYPIQIADFRLSNNIILFGDVTNTSSSSAFLLAYNNGDKPINISFSNVPEYITLPSNIPNPIKAGEKITIIATFDAIKFNNLGRSNDSFTINITSDKNEPIANAQIETVALVMEDFSRLSEQDRINAPIISLSTDKLHYSNLELNANIIDSQKLVITNRGVNDLIIRKIYSPHSYINSRIMGNFVKSGESMELTVYVTPSYIEQLVNILNEKITIISNDPVNPTIDIHLVGEIRK